MATSHEPLAHEVLQQAAQWFATLQGEHGTGERAAWQAWMNTRPEHRQAWNRVEAISGQFARIPQPVAAHQALRTDVSRRRLLSIGAVLSGGCLLAMGERSGAWQAMRADRSTGLGEIRQVPMPGGARLWLNTQSAADLGPDSITLYRGELLLEGAMGMRLGTPDGNLRLDGQRAGLREYPGHTEVIAYQGTVTAEAGGTLLTGQRGRLRRDGLSPLGALNPGAQAWTHGVLQADNMPLGAFIQELGRYRHGYLGCDPRVAELRLVGAFPLAEPERIFAALERALPVTVRRPLPWWLIVQPRQPLA
ncbi:DUF4880 domain-containing protein [Pseudomonas japonica]|uniref:DUF4880 domain-containing protein n=1 Tax=Pseudomonas japonica TaxID=256466 RepID=UPI0015E30B78|nr:DUF4880 domain-containing protein [Pseudomonas japonica]MBA1244345.1 DUF4880 domain-containing protein [Pseudomonas japonica]MBA1289626.1 DUF4880 domain-containing protein [Pseudomonas japonica]